MSYLNWINTFKKKINFHNFFSLCRESLTKLELVIKLKTMENYCLKIKKYRLQNNHTPEYIAIQMEMSLKKYENIEKGISELKLSKLDRLVEILGIQKSEIFSLDH